MVMGSKMAYRIFATFPKEEKYGLALQIKRSIVSIPLNIAKGYGRKGAKRLIKSL